MEDTTIPFTVVPHDIADMVRPPRRIRRDWRPVVAALTKGQTLFLSDHDLGDGDVKYLQLALARRGRREFLRTVRATREGISGRMLEVIITPPAGEPVEVSPA